jgi:hypothetical protein
MAGVSLAAIMSACDTSDPDPDPDPNAIDLGSGDMGLLNYTYALEQLEAAYYTQVLASPYVDMTEEEEAILTDIRDHEIAHRDYFLAVLGADAIPDLNVAFSQIDFTDRMAVLTTASVFEDLGVSAYNGAARLLTNPELLLVAGKIVSVEARHAGVIRDLLAPGTIAFAGDDVVNNNGLDQARNPDTVLDLAGPYIDTPLSDDNLPTA